MTPADTSADARHVQRAAQARLGGAGRVRLAFQMCEDARRIAIAGIRSREPGLSEADARARLLERILGRELFRAAYGAKKRT